MKNCPYSESELLEIAQGFKKHLKGLASIQDIYPDLDQDFIYRFKAKFYEVQAFVHPHTIDSEVDQTTRSLQHELDLMVGQIRSLFQVFRYNMQKICPHGPEIWDEYGYTGLERAICNQATFQQYLEGFVKLANEKRVEMKLVNCPIQCIDEIQNLSDLFGHKREELLEYLERREIREKVHKNNLSELFRLMVTVHKAASKNIDTNPEILKYLTLPSAQSKIVH
jgi:hypothetical protein